MSYHVNNEGKIYPCRATVKKCPYSQFEGRHALNKENLYHMAVILSNTVEPSKNMFREISNEGGVSDLSSLSKELEESKAPVELILSSLHYSIEALEKKENSYVNSMKERAKELREKAIDNMVELLQRDNRIGETSYGRQIGVFHKFPESMQKEAREIWKRYHNYYRISNTSSNDDYLIKSLENKVRNDISQMNRYMSFAKSNNSINNKKLEYMKSEFNHFSKLMNVSKIISNRHTYEKNEYETVDDIKNKVIALNNDQLLAAYDGCTVSDDYVRDLMVESDNFSYKMRDDLSPKAQDNLIKWHKTNLELAQRYELRSLNRILWGIEIRKEIRDRGGSTDFVLNSEKEKIDSLIE